MYYIYSTYKFLPTSPASYNLEHKKQQVYTICPIQSLQISSHTSSQVEEENNFT